MTLEIDMQDNWYTPKNGSIFLIEEVSKRKDFRIYGKRKSSNSFEKNPLIFEENAWTKDIHQQTIDLFARNFNQLTEDERRIFRLLSTDNHFFLGPYLHLQFHVILSKSTPLLILFLGRRSLSFPSNLSME